MESCRSPSLHRRTAKETEPKVSDQVSNLPNRMKIEREAIIARSKHQCAKPCELVAVCRTAGKSHRPAGLRVVFAGPLHDIVRPRDGLAESLHNTILAVPDWL
ncbi:hypothetical protein AMTR_s00119p00046370 [Amborella trichopoda]|uniref:Uncharacterized protein n=1 Tax=Amborella trichopoda TaxID=13333 RepID=W1NQU9_AMBTC|nr:hypothetical protein AMTR_s00119p00046370 [Amborella trichopoda]